MRSLTKIRTEIMLTILLIMAIIGQGQSWDSLGESFVTIFPENIAFYYPLSPVNSLNITAVLPNTVVEVFISGQLTYTNTLPAGKPVTVTLPVDIEEYQFGETSQTVRISSTKRIVVQSISKKADSVQTNVIQPQKNLGTIYTIPLLNYRQMINTFYQSARNVSKRYSSFRLVIINGEDQINNVRIVKRSTDKIYILDPFTALQLQTDRTETEIYSDYRVAVMLTHPCVEVEECRCNMVLNQLYPDAQWDSRFVVPSILNTSNFWLHVTSSMKTSANGGDLESSTVDAYSSKLLSLPSLQLGSQFINTSNPASLRLVSPSGIIIEPISQYRFSACYLVPVSSTDAKALIIAETYYRDSVYIDNDLLLSTKWSPIANSVYSSVSVSLDDTHIIWHPSTKIAVYVFEKSTNVYGGPAISLSAKPDPLGCAFVPSKFDIIVTPQTWPESHQYCKLISDELFSPSNEEAQAEMTNILNNEGMNERLWIGVRRSLMTLEWYRQKGNSSHNLPYTRWGTGEPCDAVKGMCASVFPNPSMDFHWETTHCCTQLKSICYTRAQYFLISNETASNSHVPENEA